jgi:hypothetical protein
VSRNAGLSLIELLVAVGVSMMFFAGFSAFYLSEQRSFAQGWSETDASGNLRTALEQIVRELRVAGLNPTKSSVGNCGLTLANADRVEFLIDADDADPFTAPGCDQTNINEKRGFRRSDDEIQAWVGGVAGWETLADRVAAGGSLFTYYRSDGGTGFIPFTAADLPLTSANLALVRRVDVRVPVEHRGPLGTFTRTEVASAILRNKIL